MGELKTEAALAFVVLFIGSLFGSQIVYQLFVWIDRSQFRE
jgi:hypothetical protein